MDRRPPTCKPDPPASPQPDTRAWWRRHLLRAGLMCGPFVFVIGVVVCIYSAIHQGSIVGYTIGFDGDRARPTHAHPEWELMLLLGYALVAFGGLLTVAAIGTAITHRPLPRRIPLDHLPSN